jgi:hypothetical protein
MELVMSGPLSKQADSSSKTGETGVHPIVIKIAIGAALWFLAVTWIDFGGERETDFLLVIVILFFAFFLGLFLLTASYTLGDQRWPVQDMSLKRFLISDVGIGGETMRGRDVLIEIALLPVALALAATLIGLAWVIFG